MARLGGEAGVAALPAGGSDHNNPRGDPDRADTARCGRGDQRWMAHAASTRRCGCARTAASVTAAITGDATDRAPASLRPTPPPGLADGWPLAASPRPGILPPAAPADRQRMDRCEAAVEDAGRRGWQDQPVRGTRPALQRPSAWHSADDREAATGDWPTHACSLARGSGAPRCQNDKMSWIHIRRRRWCTKERRGYAARPKVDLRWTPGCQEGDRPAIGPGGQGFIRASSI